MKKLICILLGLLMLLSLAACGTQKAGPADSGPKEDQGASTPAGADAPEADKSEVPADTGTETGDSEAETADEAFTITDLADREVTFDRPVSRFIDQSSGSGGAFFTACAILGDELCDYMVGWDDGITKWRTDFYNHFVEEMPELADVKMVGSITSDNFDFEAVVTSGAEVIFMTRGSFASVEDGIVKKIEDAGIKIVCLDYQAQQYEKHMQCIEIVGKLLGREERAREIIEFYTDAVKDIYPQIDGLLAANGGVRPVVYGEWGKNDDPLTTFSTSWSDKTQWGGIVYSLGGIGLGGDGSNGANPEVDPEYILTSDPDMIFLSAVSPESKEEAVGVGHGIYVGFDVTEEAIEVNRQVYMQRPGWENLTAVKENKVYVIPHPIHREVFDCSSIQAVAKIMWPEAFSDLDPVKTYQEFWDRFMPFTLSGVWYYGF